MPFTKSAIAAVAAFVDLAAGLVDLENSYTFSIKNKACRGVTMLDYAGAKDTMWKFESTLDPKSTPTAFKCDAKTIQPPTSTLTLPYWNVGYIYPVTNGSAPKTLRIPAYTTDGRNYNGCVTNAEYVEPGASAWTGCVYLID